MIKAIRPETQISEVLEFIKFVSNVEELKNEYSNISLILFSDLSGMLARNSGNSNSDTIMTLNGIEDYVNENSLKEDNKIVKTIINNKALLRKILDEVETSEIAESFIRKSFKEKKD